MLIQRQERQHNTLRNFQRRCSTHERVVIMGVDGWVSLALSNLMKQFAPAGPPTVTGAYLDSIDLSGRTMPTLRACRSA